MLPSKRLRRSIADGLRAVNLAATLACLAWGGRAAAHPEYAPSTVNRYLKIDLVAPGELRLAYTIMVGPAPAAAWRRAADANADGKLDEAEQRALGERVRRAAANGLSLTVDGARVALPFDAPVVGLAGAEVAPSPFSVDLVARLALPGTPPHTVRVDDTTPEPELGDTEIRVEESPATQLLTAHRGATGEPGEKQTHFLFHGQKFSALEDRSVGFAFTAAAPPPVPANASATGSGSWQRNFALAAGAVIVLGLVLLLVRRRGASAG
jgi:hypothetical protein